MSEDTKALIDHVAENPLLYAAAAGFVLVCILVAVYIGVSRKAAAQAEMTQLASAVENEDAAARAALLDGLAKEAAGRRAATAAYLAGEAEIRARNYDKAEEHFLRVVNEFPESEHAADAAEALGFLAENRGAYEAAVQRYRQVAEQWPNSFAARCVPVKLGRALEALERDVEAVDAYCEQFRKFPRAWTTAAAMSGVDTLGKSEDTAVAEAAKAGFKRLSEEFPALFMELYPQYFVPAEEPEITVSETIPSEALPEEEASPGETTEQADEAETEQATVSPENVSGETPAAEDTEETLDGAVEETSEALETEVADEAPEAVEEATETSGDEE
ncbi:MAG TPA: tetratricopeptide repeat protein [Candidatus Hydrogenedentes bacterium]|nr:tetratricopeptide repeat protein [Candidatus Hydrogenedentota bacterium]HNT87664.1 tetratricopeptide repeat protein [Candidatus Hydrogenedentota bacterium]